VPQPRLTERDRAAEYRAARGEFREALPLAQQAHALYRARLGDDHPNALSSATNLAIRLADLGEHEQARALTEDTLTRQRRVLGDDHPDTLRSAHNLANRLADLGEHEQARALADDTLARSRRVLGMEHALTAKAREIVDWLDKVGPARAEEADPSGR
jgi:tetratricopeptide (TPR) repeat protein